MEGGFVLIRMAAVMSSRVLLEMEEHFGIYKYSLSVVHVVLPVSDIV